MAGTATTPIVGGQPVQNVSYQIEGTNTAADGAKVAGVVVLDPTTGLPSSGGGGGGGGAVSIADGEDVTQGALADVAVQGDTAGTVSAKLRGLNKAVGTTADTAASTTILGYLLKIAALLPGLGQKTMAASQSVTIANNQSSVPVAAQAGSAIIGKVGLDQTTPGTTNATTPVDTTGTPLFSEANPGVVQQGDLAPASDGVYLADHTTTTNTAKVDASGNLYVVSAPGAYTVAAATTLQSAATGNANGSTLAVAGQAAVEFNITASVAPSGGTAINFEYSPDNSVTWVALRAFNEGTATWATSTTAVGVWRASVLGVSGSLVRARIGSYSAGTITVTGAASPAGGPISMEATLSTALARTIDSIDTNHYGTPTVTTVSVTTGSTSVLASSATRFGFLLVNVGANNIWVNLAGGTAVNTNTLLAPGGNLLMDGPYVVTGAVTAIAATSSTNLSVTEFV